MSDNELTRVNTRAAADLDHRRRRILAMPAQDALEAVLDAPRPVSLVQSFPEEDLYFLVKDIGPEDSLPILGMASNHQWHYFLDMEAWERDRPRPAAITRWLSLLLKADPDRFIHWCLKEQTEFIEYYLFRNIEVKIREHDQDPSIFGQDYFTLDEVYYIRVRKDFQDPEVQATGQGMEDEREEFLLSFLQRLASHDYKAFQNVIYESVALIPAETEEETYRLRNVRLAEKGFLSFEEAVGVYQPLKPADLAKQAPKYISQEEERFSSFPVPQSTIGFIPGSNRFAQALQKIDSQAVLMQIQGEFAALCNQVLAADQLRIRERKELKEIVQKTSGYISIGLEAMAGDGPGDAGHRERTAARDARLIRHFPLIALFRVGYGTALKIKWEADRWLQSSWFLSQGLPLGFWGETWMGVLGGLLIKKPLFFDNYRRGVIYREFETLKEVRETREAFDCVRKLDGLMRQAGVKASHFQADEILTYKNLLLTLWARHMLGLSEELVHMPLADFKTFFGRLFSGPGASSFPRRISDEMKTSCLTWLSGKSGADPLEVSRQLGFVLADLFEELESEYGQVAPADLDPRYLHLFLVAPEAGPGNGDSPDEPG